MFAFNNRLLSFHSLIANSTLIDQKKKNPKRKKIKHFGRSNNWVRTKRFQRLMKDRITITKIKAKVRKRKRIHKRAAEINLLVLVGISALSLSGFSKVQTTLFYYYYYYWSLSFFWPLFIFLPRVEGSDQLCCAYKPISSQMRNSDHCHTLCGEILQFFWFVNAHQRTHKTTLYLITIVQTPGAFSIFDLHKFLVSNYLYSIR